MAESNSLNQDTMTKFVLISFREGSDKKIQFKVVDLYKTEEEAYATALVSLLQVIETSTENWPKAMLSEKQEQVIELCRYIKEDLTAYKDRFIYMSSQCDLLFQDLCHIQYQVVPVNQVQHSNIPRPLTESIFKTKVRNLLDVFKSRLEVQEEEDLDNSDGDDDEEEEVEEEDEEEEDVEEDIEDEEEELGEEEEEEEEDDEELDEEDEEEEIPTSETAVPESSDIEEEESNDKKRKRDVLEEEEEEEEEDEIDEDELEDEEDAGNKKKRIESS